MTIVMSDLLQLVRGAEPTEGTPEHLNWQGAMEMLTGAVAEEAPAEEGAEVASGGGEDDPAAA